MSRRLLELPPAENRVSNLLIHKFTLDKAAFCDHEERQRVDRDSMNHFINLTF
jgi:hypothetical protein